MIQFKQSKHFEWIFYKDVWMRIGLFIVYIIRRYHIVSKKIIFYAYKHSHENEEIFRILPAFKQHKNDELRSIDQNKTRWR